VLEAERGAVLDDRGRVEGQGEVTQNGDKLGIVDPSKTIQRHACKVCGVHMYGRIENNKHAFYGLDFVTRNCRPNRVGPRRDLRPSSPRSSRRARIGDMGAVRSRLKELGLEPYELPESSVDGCHGDELGQTGGYPCRREEVITM